MNTTTSSTRTEGLLALYDLHTLYFERAIENISDDDAYNRLNTKANHIAWLTGSLVYQRYELIKENHTELAPTGGQLFENNKGLQDDAQYPTLAQYLQDWKKISPVTREEIIKLTDEKLDSEIDMGFMKMSFYELLTFTIYREASMIGQLALWRRLLDYPALRYDD